MQKEKRKQVAKRLMTRFGKSTLRANFTFRCFATYFATFTQYCFSFSQEEWIGEVANACNSPRDEDVASLCIINRSRNSSDYTLSLLSLLEFASHTDKLTLYTTMASHTYKHTVFNSLFFSLTCLDFHSTLIQTQ